MQKLYLGHVLDTEVSLFQGCLLWLIACCTTLKWLLRNPSATSHHIVAIETAARLPGGKTPLLASKLSAVIINRLNYMTATRYGFNTTGSNVILVLASLLCQPPLSLPYSVWGRGDLIYALLI